MGFIKDFREFAIKGSVIDLAVGVIIGGAFGKIVTATVDDIIMPIVSTVTGKGQFTDLFYVISPGKNGEVYNTLEEARKAGANVFAYGDFIQTIVDFLIVALIVFMAIRLLAHMRRREEKLRPAEPFGPSATEKLLEEIRDELRKK
jgi:large conductance mechanosensitive channel